METHPIVVIIRALYAHLPRYHDNGDATTVAVRCRETVAIHENRMSRHTREEP